MTTLKIFKTNYAASLPKFSTDHSACFDIAFQPYGKISYEGYDLTNSKFSRNLHDGRIYMNSGDRVMVPSGLILDIPEGYSVRVHPRSGLSLKQGLMLANCEGVIDSDYTDELFVLIYNSSQNGQFINPGDRIAQAELIKSEVYTIQECAIPPGKKGNRIGGFGSTGVAKTAETIGVLTITPATVQNEVVIKEEDKTPPVPVKRGRGRPKKVLTSA